jgi:hypothetical protein
VGRQLRPAAHGGQHLRDPVRDRPAHRRSAGGDPEPSRRRADHAEPHVGSCRVRLLPAGPEHLPTLQ